MRTRLLVLRSCCSVSWLLSSIFRHREDLVYSNPWLTSSEPPNSCLHFLFYFWISIQMTQLSWALVPTSSVLTMPWLSSRWVLEEVLCCSIGLIPTQTVEKCVTMGLDLLTPIPTIAHHHVPIAGDYGSETAVMRMLPLLTTILQGKNLIHETTKILKGSEQFGAVIRDLCTQLVEKLIKLSSNTKNRVKCGSSRYIQLNSWLIAVAFSRTSLETSPGFIAMSSTKCGATE